MERVHWPRSYREARECEKTPPDAAGLEHEVFCLELRDCRVVYFEMVLFVVASKTRR